MNTIGRGLLLLMLAAGAWAGAAVGQAADTDGDGVPNDADQCPYTAPNAGVNERGCSLSADEDLDGIADASDECPYSPPNAVVDDKGCALDADFDGIPDGLDRCSGTDLGAKVNLEGCGEGQTPSSPSTTAEVPGEMPAGADVESAAHAASDDAGSGTDGVPAAGEVTDASPLPEKQTDLAAPTIKASEPRLATSSETAALPAKTAVKPVVTEVEVPLMRSAAAAADPAGVSVRLVPGDALATLTIIEWPLRIGDKLIGRPASSVSAPDGTTLGPIAAPTRPRPGAAYVYNRPVVAVPTGPRDQIAKLGLRPELMTAGAVATGLAESAEALARVIKRVHFATRSHQITPFSMNLLDGIVAELQGLLNRDSKAKLELVGYADPGTEQAGAGVLAEQRADAVRRYLISKGLDGDRLRTRAAGAVQPMKPAGDPEAKRLNPRVEIRAVN